MVVKIKDSAKLMAICTDIISKTNDWVWEVDVDGFFTFCSEDVEDILGYSPKECLKINIFKYLPPSNVENFSQITDMKISFLHKNGEEIYTNINAIPYFNENNEFQGYRGTSNIITEEIKDINYSKTLDNVSRLISENINDLICIIDDSNYKIEFINGNKFLKLLGHSDQNLIGQRFIDLINPKDHRKIGKLFKSGFSSTKSIKEIQVKKSNDSYIWVEIKSTKFKDKDLKKKFLLVLRDITPQMELIEETEEFKKKIRKISESVPEIKYWKLLQPKEEIGKQLLQESEKKYKDIINHLDVGFFKSDINGIILTHNPALNKIFGYDPKENLVGLSGSVLWPDKEDFTQKISSLIKTGKERDFKYEVYKKDGEQIIINVNSHLVYDKNENPIEIEGTVTDITEKSILELKLKESEKKYRTIIENTKDIIVIIGLDGKSNYISPQFSKALGGLEISNEGDLFAHIHPDDRVELMNLFKGALKNKTVKIYEEIEFRIKHPDGRYLWFASMAKNYLDDMGNVIGFISSLRDITERKKAEKHFQRMIEFSSDIISIMGLDGNILYQSPSCVNIFGYTADEMIGTITYDYMHPDDRTNVINTLAEGIRMNLKVGRVECRIKNKDDSWRLVEAIGSNLLNYKGTQGIIVNTRDITERKKMEQELKESEKRYRNIIENTADAITIIGLDGRLKFVSPQLSSILGKKINKDDNFFKHIHPDDILILREAYKTIFKEKELQSKENIEFRLKHADGHYVWLYSSTKNYLDDDGKIIGFISELRDVSYRKAAEQKLKDSEEKYRSLINNITDVIVELDLKGKYLYISPQCYDITGYRPEEVIGTSSFDFLHPDELETSMELFDNAIKSKQIATIEHMIRHKDGSYVNVSSRTTLVNIEGEFKIIGVIRDISKRKKAEQKLKDSEEKYRSLINNITDVIAELDLEGVFKYVSPQCYDVTGYRPEELIEKKNTDYVHPDDLSYLAEAFKNSIESKQINTLDFRTHHKDGYYVPVSIRSTLVDVEGEKKIFAVLRDNSERKKAEQKLRESEEKYRLISENANDLIAIINENFEYEYVNEETYYRVTGFNKEELIGNIPFALAHSDDKEQAIESIKKGFKTGEGMASLRFKNKTGSYLWLEVKGKTFLDKNHEKKMLVIARDITKRKEAELQIYEFNKLLEGIIEERTKELRQSEKRLKKKSEEQALLLDNIETQIWYLKDGETYGAVNRAYADFIGVDEKYIENKHVTDFRDKEIADLCISGNLDVFTYKKQYRNEEWIKNAQGERRYFSVIKTPKLDDNGDVEYVVCTAENITERKLVEDKLRESEIRFRTIAEQSLLGIVIIQDGLVKYANRAVSAINGYSMEEMNHWGIHEFQRTFHPEDFSYLMTRIQTREENRGPEIIQIPARIITKKGRTKWLEVYSKSLIYQGKPAVFATMVDISDKKKAEESLRESEAKLREQNLELMKLDKLKDDFITIAAHELKTPLISIIGYMDLILTRNEVFDPEMKEDLERVLSNANRLQNYINQLMDVMKIDSKEISLDLKNINMHNVVKDCVSEVIFQLERKNLEIDIIIDGEINLNVDSFRMSQVFSNLLSNAIKFSKQYDKIEISVIKGDYYYLFKVRDNGVGLDKREILRLFKKFVMINQNTENFNAAERGSGLGLYITKGIVEAHGGKIWVISNGKDKGTEVNFTLPL